jgi:hypothetical protein
MDVRADIDLMITSMQKITEHLRADADAPAGSVHKISLKEAAYIAGISEAQMRKRCEENNAYGVVAGGFGYKRRGRWEVVFVPFINSLPVSALARVK